VSPFFDNATDMIATTVRKRSLRKSAPRKKTASKKVKKRKADIAASYNAVKEYNGKQYTGMAIGRSHKWYYDKGEWKETKITPDLWEVFYAVTKRRAGRAPEGSGVAVGTGYHWYIMAHQDVRKLNANDYSTVLSGFKYKVAHKRASSDKWSATTGTQRKHLIKYLKEMIDQLENSPVAIEFEYDGNKYKGEAIPVKESCQDGVCFSHEVSLNGEHQGIINRAKSGWKMNEVKDQKLIDAIGQAILLWYE
jgi:hypothetical protein